MLARHRPRAPRLAQIIGVAASVEGFLQPTAEGNELRVRLGNGRTRYVLYSGISQFCQRKWRRYEIAAIRLAFRLARFEDLAGGLPGADQLHSVRLFHPGQYFLLGDLDGQPLPWVSMGPEFALSPALMSLSVRC